VQTRGAIVEGLSLSARLSELGFGQRCVLRVVAPEMYAAARCTASAAREDADRSGVRPSWFTSPVTKAFAGLR